MAIYGQGVWSTKGRGGHEAPVLPTSERRGEHRHHEGPPEEEQDQMGLSEGMVRISIGIDNDISRTFEKMKTCMKNVGIL